MLLLTAATVPKVLMCSHLKCTKSLPNVKRVPFQEHLDVEPELSLWWSDVWFGFVCIGTVVVQCIGLYCIGLYWHCGGPMYWFVWQQVGGNILNVQSHHQM